jgi:anaerobic carbon-monoxide dehydrogenase iron sulfur subunit
MNKQLFADPEKCTGCNRCASVCSAMKTGSFAPSFARIKVNNFPHRGFAVPSVCFQCPNAPCHKACPSGAISRNEDDVVVVDSQKCIACGSCVKACPYGMIELGEQLTAAKCDHCGGDPACVKECFPGALVFTEKTPELMKLKGTQMKQRSTDGRSEEKRNRLGRAILKNMRG